jgi:hypothetical protein
MLYRYIELLALAISKVTGKKVKSKRKGKGHPITGHEGPEGE